MTKSASTRKRPASERTDHKIARTMDWRNEILGAMRTLILAAVPDIIEEVKWRKASNAMLGVPVWSQDGILCTGETYKDKVKLTFARGASLKDPARLFNSSLDGNTRRAIDIHENEEIDPAAFTALVFEAVAFNAGLKKQKPSRAR